MKKWYKWKKWNGSNVTYIYGIKTSISIFMEYLKEKEEYYATAAVSWVDTQIYFGVKVIL